MVDSIYRRANERLQAKGSEKDKVEKGRSYELCQMIISRVAFQGAQRDVPVNDAVQNCSGSG